MTAPSMADTQTTCMSIKDASEAVMGARQAGVPVERVMSIMATDKMMSAMIHDAYTSYGYSSDEYKLSVVNDFGAKYYLDCMARNSR